MEKAASRDQFCEFTGKMLVTIKQEHVDTMDSAMLQQAIRNFDKGILQVELIKWINNGCQLETVVANAFTVGQVFRQRATKGDTRMDISGNTNEWLIKPNINRVIRIDTTPHPLVEYVLPQNMNDSKIQEEARNPGMMTEDEFLLLMYLCIFAPTLAKQVFGFNLRKDKYYVCHVLVGGKKKAFGVGWDGGEWYFNADGFGRNGAWSRVDVFLYFAAAK